MYYIVARIISYGKLVGYKLINRYNVRGGYYENADYSVEKLENALRAGLKIENATLENDKIKGVGGSLSRYSAISNSGELLSEMSIVIIYKSSDYYTICNPFGAWISISESNLIIRVQANNKIANGKLCQRVGVEPYISAIEGEIHEEETEPIKIKENSSKKFKVRILSKSHEKYLPTKQFTESFIEQSKGVSEKTVVKRCGLSIGVYGDRVYNEVFETVESELRYNKIGITEVKFGEHTHFLVLIHDKEYILDDILYIGDGWRSVAREQNTLGNDLRFIGLGKLGLIILNRESLQGKEEQQQLLECECITYCKIDTVDKLTKELISHDITPECLDRNDLRYILKTASEYVYKIKHDIKLSSLHGREETKLENKDYKSLISMEYLSFNNISQFGSYRGSCEYVAAHMRRLVIEELELALINYNGFVHFSHSSNVILSLNSSIDRINIVINDNEFVLSYKGTKLQHVAYIALHQIGLVEKISNSWVEDATYKGLVGSMIIESNDTELIMLLSEKKLVYNISELKREFEADLIKLAISKEKAKKINNKLAILGDDTTINPAGYIDSWVEGSNIVQIQGIKGLIISEKSRTKRLTVFINDEFDIINRTEYSTYYFNTGITFVYNIKTVDQYMKNFYNLGTGIDIEGLKAEELDTLISVYLRSLMISGSGKNPTNVIINGEHKKLGFNITELKCRQLFKLSGRIFEHNRGNALSLKVYNKDGMSLSEKAKFLSMCLNSIPTNSGGIKLDIAVDLFKSIVKVICTDTEKESILMSLTRWLSK